MNAASVMWLTAFRLIFCDDKVRKIWMYFETKYAVINVIGATHTARNVERILYSNPA